MCEDTKKQQESWLNQAGLDHQRQYDPRAAQAALGGVGGAVQTIVGVGVGKYAGPGSRQILQDRARRLRAEAQQCEALAASIPDNLPAEADQALRELLSRSGR